MLPRRNRTSVCVLACALAAALTYAARAANAPDLPGGPRPAKAVTLSVRPSLGVLEGEAREVVYVPGEAGRHKVSELTWELAGVILGGVTVSAELGSRLALHAGVWTGLNEGDGGMTDTDWRLEGQPWTDWSISDASVTRALLLDLNAAWLLWRNDRGLALRCLAGYRRDSWRWEDSLRQFVYSLQDFRDFAGTAEGVNTIRYEQEFDVPYVGAGLELPLGKARFSACLRYSAWLDAADRDFHVLRELHFEGSFAGGTYLGYGLAIASPLSSRLSVSVALDGQQIPELDGDLFIVEQNAFLPNSAGIAHESLTLSGQACWRF
jgi:outer membrane protease